MYTEYKRNMRTLHQSLRLQHHRHTGKWLHHRHTSYRALAVVFVVAGIFIVALNMVNRAAADDFGVTAMVAAPLPTNPPIISSPSAGTNISGSSTMVIGSCPLISPQAVVSVNVDGSSAGTGVCDSNNDFTVPVTLSPGDHQISATALNITGQTGPTSIPFTIHSQSDTMAAGIPIYSDQPFVYAGAKDITWTGTIGSGQANEYVHIDWGDNTQSNVTVQPGPQSFSHHYATLTSHNILLAASTSGGTAASRQYASSAYSSYTPTALVSSTNSSGFGTTTVMGLYGLYISALAVTGIVWLEAKHAARQHQHTLA